LLVRCALFVVNYTSIVPSLCAAVKRLVDIGLTAGSWQKKTPASLLALSALLCS
jgi:hypothetical protein